MKVVVFEMLNIFLLANSVRSQMYAEECLLLFIFAVIFSNFVFFILFKGAPLLLALHNEKYS